MPEIDAAIVDCEQAVKDTEATIFAAIDACGSECTRSIADCHSCVLGKLSAMMDEADKLIGKCESKILNLIDEYLYGSYNDSYEFFPQIPSIDQVVADILGEPLPEAPAPQPVTPAAGLPKAPPPQPPQPPAPSGECPPGTIPQFLQDGQGNWTEVCTPIGGGPSPSPTPGPTCNVLPPSSPPTCPPGQHAELDTQTNTWVCRPNLPTCDPPTRPCDPGFHWEWDAIQNGWQCKPNLAGGSPPIPSPGPEPCGPAQFDPAVPGFGVPDESKNWCQPAEFSQEKNPPTLAELMGFIGPNGESCEPAWLQRAFEGLPKVVRIILGTLILIVLLATDLIRRLIPIPQRCQSAVWGVIAFIRSLYGFASRWFGIELGPAGKIFEQWHNTACPQVSPSFANGMAMYLTNQIDLDQLKGIGCTEALSNAWVEKLALASKSRYDVLQLVQLYRRGHFNVEHYSERVRQLGYTEKDAPATLLAVTEDLPTQADIIQYMVRDAADDTIAEKYQLDEAFDRKFAGILQRWATIQGIPISAMKMAWRSHWVYPSNTAAFVMLQRLRADSLDPMAKANAVTEDQILELMGINDQAPAWRKKLLATTYNPITRTELRLGYEAGELGDAEVYSGLRDNGLNDFNASLVLRLFRRRKIQRMKTQGRSMSIAKTIDFYKAGAIDVHTALTALERNGIAFNDRAQMIADADLDLEATMRKQQIGYLHKLFLVGEWDAAGAINELTGRGVSNEQAQILVSQWEAELSYRGKQVGAAQLCKWRYWQLITPYEHYQRLRLIGYSVPSAERISASCEADNAYTRLIRAQKQEDRQRRLAKGGGKNGKGGTK